MEVDPRCDTDVLIVHGPPRGFGDVTLGLTSSGSVSLAERIVEIQPPLVVCGHIHEGYGVYETGATTIANASLHNVHFQPANAPIVFDLHKATNPDAGVTSRVVVRVA